MHGAVFVLKKFIFYILEKYSVLTLDTYIWVAHLGDTDINPLNTTVANTHRVPMLTDNSGIDRVNCRLKYDVWYFRETIQ